MKKRKQNWLIGLIIALALFFLTFPVLVPYLYPPISTEYSEGFDKGIYNKIAIGDKKNVVDSLLGKPLFETTSFLEKDGVHLDYWYSKGTSSFLGYENIRVEFYDNEVINKICFIDFD